MDLVGGNSSSKIGVKIVFMQSEFRNRLVMPFKFLSVNNFFFPLCVVFPATNRLVHVCAAVLPAQPKSATR